MKYINKKSRLRLFRTTITTQPLPTETRPLQFAANCLNLIKRNAFVNGNDSIGLPLPGLVGAMGGGIMIAACCFAGEHDAGEFLRN